MSDSLKSMGPEQPRDCCVCGRPIKWGDQDAMYSLMSLTSMHNACARKYEVRRKS